MFAYSYQGSSVPLLLMDADCVEPFGKAGLQLLSKRRCKYPCMKLPAKAISCSASAASGQTVIAQARMAAITTEVSSIVRWWD